MKRKFISVIIVVAILTVVLVIGFNSYERGDKPVAIKMNYPALSLPTMGMFITAKFGDIVKDADAIVLGKVIKRYENVKVELVNQEGSPEDMIMKKIESISEGAIDRRASYVMITEIKVEECIQGKTDSDIITIRQPQGFKGYVPELSEGQEMVFFLTKPDTLADYIPLHPHSAFFYKNDSGLVYPASSDEDFVRFKNIEWTDFKKQIKDFDRDSYKSHSLKASNLRG